MVTEKDKEFRKGILHTLKEYKVDWAVYDELIFWIMKAAKRIYLDEEL